MNRRTELALTIVLAATAIVATAACIWPDSLLRKLVLGLGGIIAFLLVGSAKANPRRDNALEKEASVAEQSARDKVLSTDPRDVVSGLKADTAQGSIEPKPRESQPASTRPERSYTEEEALAAAEAAARKAVDVAIPLAVQAAVAEERGKTAAQQLLDRGILEALTRQARNWRAMALIAMGAGTGSLADGGRGALYGAAGGAVATVVWWIVEFWPKRASALAPP